MTGVLAAKMAEKEFRLRIGIPQIIGNTWTGLVSASTFILAIGNSNPDYIGRSREVYEHWMFRFTSSAQAELIERGNDARLQFDVSIELDVATNKISCYALRNVNVTGKG